MRILFKLVLHRVLHPTIHDNGLKRIVRPRYLLHSLVVREVPKAFGISGITRV